MATRVLMSDKGLRVETTLEDAEAAKIVEEGKKADDDFAAKLVDDWHRYQGLTPNKLAWLHKKAIDILAAEMGADEPKHDPVGNYDQLFALFARASRLQYPTIVFETETGAKLQMVYVKDGRNADTISLSSGAKSAGGVWYGRIKRGGEIFLSKYHKMTESTVKMLDEINKDPVKVARECGKRTGRCCYCNTSLTEPRSINAGYGPTCAKNYGLPY